MKLTPMPDKAALCTGYIVFDSRASGYLNVSIADTRLYASEKNLIPSALNASTATPSHTSPSMVSVNDLYELQI